MKPTYNCLYYLENATHCILEIKRTDLEEDADISIKFRWLFLNKNTKQVQSLIFRSMDSSGEVQERFFEQGYLKFNEQIGTYIEKFNSAQHQMDNRIPAILPEEIQQIINAHLLQ